ncbi:cyclic nucleotide-binding domain-containing protein [PVC group bacterium]|nr:cyclic nucleotide-binding domain-containing protein [PVC group bacterium]
MSKARFDFLKKVSIFEGLTDKDIEKVESICTTSEKKENDIVFIEQSIGKELYIVLEGEVEIQIELISPEEFVPIRKMCPGDVFGELALIDTGARSATARCSKASKFIIIEREEFLTLLEADHRFGYIVMRNLARLVCGRIRQTNQRLLDNVSWGLV